MTQNLLPEPPRNPTFWKVTVYCDVDGVINAGSPKYDWGEQKEASVAFDDEGLAFKIRWAPDLIKRLKALRANFVWATTWQYAAPEGLADVLDFGHSKPVLEPLSGVVDFPSIHWKFEAMQDQQALRPHPFVWIDDEIDYWHRSWAEKNGGLALAPNDFFGITPAMMDRIEEFIAQHETD